MFSHSLALASGRLELIAEAGNSGKVEVYCTLPIKGDGVLHFACCDKRHGTRRADFAKAMGWDGKWAPITDPGGPHVFHAVDHRIDIICSRIKDMWEFGGCGTVLVETHTSCKAVGHHRPQWAITHQIEDLRGVAQDLRGRFPTFAVVPLLLVSHNDPPKKWQWFAIREDGA